MLAIFSTKMNIVVVEMIFTLPEFLDLLAIWELSFFQAVSHKKYLFCLEGSNTSLSTLYSTSNQSINQSINQSVNLDLLHLQECRLQYYNGEHTAWLQLPWV